MLLLIGRLMPVGPLVGGDTDAGAAGAAMAELLLQLLELFMCVRLPNAPQPLLVVLVLSFIPQLMLGEGGGGRCVGMGMLALGGDA